MNVHRDRAVELLVNYCEAMLASSAPDYTAAGAAVDQIVAAAVQEAGDVVGQQLDQHHRDVLDGLEEVVRRLDKHEQQIRLLMNRRIVTS